MKTFLGMCSSRTRCKGTTISGTPQQSPAEKRKKHVIIDAGQVGWEPNPLETNLEITRSYAPYYAELCSVAYRAMLRNL
jgi:hypothetical protein